MIVALRDSSGGTFDLPEGTVYPRACARSSAGLVPTPSIKEKRTDIPGKTAPVSP
jgi:hypothetical protein